MMRKYIVGALVGFLLTLPFTAFSSSSPSSIGKKISNEYDVVVDGKKLDVKAVALNGTSYTPNRALSEAIGYDIAFKDSTVIFSNKVVATVTDPTTTTSTGLSLEAIQFKLDGINIQLTTLKGALDPSVTPSEEGRINIQTKIEELEKLKTDLEAKKAQLEAQATPTPQ